MKSKPLPSVVLCVALLCALVLASAHPWPTIAQAPGEPSRADCAPGRLLVQFAPGVVPEPRIEGNWHTGEPALDGLLAEQGIQGAARLFPAASGEAQSDPYGLSHIYLLTLPAGSDVLGTAAALASGPGVEWAEPDYLAYPAATTPNDPLFSEQWGLAQIQAPAAWDVETGSPAVVIAVVDSGLDMSHPDLSGKVWTNPGEIPGNGLDDDNNGYVDDVHGWDLVNDDNDPSDDNGHGTQVAGIAAAATDNGEGIAGTCWGCRVMPVKAMQAGGAANYSDIALGVVYAADKGAEVINLSLGGYSDSSTLHAAVQSAVDAGAVVVAGAGNDDVNTPFYPAAYPEVIAVAGTDPSDAKAPFSDYGEWVDISAPAVDITTTFLGGDYGAVGGTSYGAPFVSGLVGLVRSSQPDWSAPMAGAQVLYTADPIDAQNPGYAGLLGHGRVNAFSALTEAAYPMLEIASTAVNGDPLGQPEPGESATLEVTLGNEWLDASGVVGLLGTSDPYTSVEQPVGYFGNIAAGSTGTGSPVYSFSVALEAGYNHPIAFTLVVMANGGRYVVSLPLTLTTRSAEEPVSGTIVADTTWTSDKTYVVTGNLGVAPGVTLTVEAGTVVEFAGDYSLNVGGMLVADGTEAHPIRFRHHNAGSWGRVLFDDPSQDATVDGDGNYLGGNILRWVWVEGASQGIGCNSATPYLSHLHSTGGGMSCTVGASSLWLLDSDLAGDTAISGGSEQRLGSWQTRSSMPTARWGLGVAAANGKIYAIGGNNGGGLTAVEEYDPGADTWTPRASMPTARYGVGVAALNGKIYAIGGNSGGPLSLVEEYDPAADTWTTRTSMPTARWGLGLAAAGGKLYAIGGSGGYSTVEEYDPATDTWTARASMPTPRWQLGVATASSGKIYAVGGWNESSTWWLATVEEYDPATDTWTTRASMPTPRRGLAVAAAANGKLYAVGGGDDYPEVYSAVEEYSPATDTWTTLASMPTARRELGMAAAGSGKLYAIGGRKEYLGQVIYSTVEEFAPPMDSYSCHVRESVVHSGNLALCDSAEVLACTVEGSLTTVSGDISDTNVGGSIAIDNSGTVAGSAAGGGIGIGGGTVRNNTVTGGIGIGSGEVLSNTLTGGGISAGDRSLVKGNDVENAPGWAIQGSGDVTVTGNRVVGNSGGIWVSGGSVEGNLVANNSGTGLEINGDVTVINNTFTGNQGSTVKIVSATSLQIAGNNLEFNAGPYDVENLVPIGTLPTLPAQGNWWGTTDPGLISQRIFDFYDDYNKGEVVFDPPRSGSAEDAPAYVRSVTLTPPSPVGIETVAFDVQFSQAMDIAAEPQMSFVTPDSWVARTSAPELLGEVGVAAAANGKLYAIRGWGTAVLEYDPATDAWTARAAGPGEHGGDGMGVVAAGNGKIYAIGGSRGFPACSGTVDEYDPATDTWTSRASMPGERCGLGVAAASNGKVYAMGWNANFEYDPATDTWATRANMPTLRIFLGAAAARNGKVYAIGGRDYGVLATVEEYDPATDTWTARASMPTARAYLGVVAAGNGKIYAIGGGDGWNELATVEEYDPATDTWETRPSMPTPRYFLGAAVGGNGMIYAVGGYGSDQSLAVVEESPPYFEFSAFHGGQWPAASLYRTFYDISTQVPRGAYALTVESAAGTDGIRIVPSTAFTFTVDWAGGIGDTTPPPMPTLEACAGVDPGTLSASWSAFDPDSAITLYQYAIGTAPAGTDVVNWATTPDTSFARSGLGLIAGQTYYVSVKARNEGGLWSEAATAGVVAGSGACTANQRHVYLPLVLRGHSGQ